MAAGDRPGHSGGVAWIATISVHAGTQGEAGASKKESSRRVNPSLRASSVDECPIERCEVEGLKRHPDGVGAHKKEMSFLAGRGAWPSALSRASATADVHRSEARDP